MKGIRYIGILLVFVILFSFCGCALIQRDVKNTMLSYYPEVEFVGKEKESVFVMGYGDMTCQNYQFENDDFSFDVYDCTLTRTAKFTLHGYYSNYYDCVLEEKKADISSVMEKYDISFTDDKNTFSDVAGMGGIRCGFSLPNIENNRHNIVFIFLVEDENQIEICIDFLKDIYEVIEEYVPVDENDIYNEGLIINFCKNNGEEFNIETQRFSLYKNHLVKSNMDFDKMLKNAKLEYQTFIDK